MPALTKNSAFATAPLAIRIGSPLVVAIMFGCPRVEL